jgi:hypothetical protein
MTGAVRMTVRELARLATKIEQGSNEALERLVEAREGAGGRLCVFVHPDGTGGVLWELIQG